MNVSNKRNNVGQALAKRELVGRLALVVMVLGAWLSAGAVAPSASASGTTLYVDGSVTSSGDCTSLATACKTITEALTKAAAPNSGITTVQIAGASGSFTGVYCEQITIDQSLTLEAASPDDPPALDGGAPLPGDSPNACAGSPYNEKPGNPVITVSKTNSPTVTLQHLTIQHGDASSWASAVGAIGGTWAAAGFWSYLARN